MTFVNSLFSGSPSGTDVGLTQVADLTVSANVLGNTVFGIDASAGAVRATLPPATGSGDRIVITADDATNTVEIASGDSLNGAVLGSIFPAANDVVYLIDAKAGDWTARTLPAPAAVDEFNSGAVVTSTVGTLSFAAGDVTFTDPLNVETWFAGPAADSTPVGGTASQYAVILDSNYTLLVISGPPAITDSPYVVWFSGLNNGDTLEAADPAFSDISAVGAGTLTGADQVTADGTGLVGIRVTGVGGLTLTLSGSTMHMFAEIPATAASTPLASARVMAFSGSGQAALGNVTSTTTDANNAENLFDATARVPLTNAGWTNPTFERPNSNGVTVGALEFTIQKAGRYRIDAEVGISGGQSGKAVQIVRNSTEIVAISAGYSDTSSDVPREAETYEDLAVGDTIDVRIAHQSTGTPGFNLLNILVEQVAAAETVDSGSITPVDIGHHRFVIDAVNSASMPGAVAAVVFDSFADSIGVGSIATFDGTDITVAAGANDVQLEALIHTAGTGNHSELVYFRDTADVIGIKLGDGVLTGPVSGRGVYGQGSDNIPATATIPAGTTVTLNVIHRGSANNQRAQIGSYIEVRELVGQQTVIPPTDLAVDDQAASGYFDGGTMRIQWGVVPGTAALGDIVFPAAFADTGYSFVANVEAATTNELFIVQHSVKTTTQVHYDKVFHGPGIDDAPSGAITEPFSWQAIGLKP